jgi:hypothetical protein
MHELRNPGGSGASRLKMFPRIYVLNLALAKSHFVLRCREGSEGRGQFRTEKRHDRFLVAGNETMHFDIIQTHS